MKQFNTRFAQRLIKNGQSPVEVCRVMGIGRDKLNEELAKYEQQQKRNKRNR